MELSKLPLLCDVCGRSKLGCQVWISEARDPEDYEPPAVVCPSCTAGCGSRGVLSRVSPEDVGEWQDTPFEDEEEDEGDEMDERPFQIVNNIVFRAQQEPSFLGYTLAAVLGAVLFWVLLTLIGR